MPQLEVSIQKFYTLKDKLLVITPERQGGKCDHCECKLLK